MSDLRLTGKNPEGTHLTLTDAQGSEFTVRISDTLRATVNQPRLTAVDTSQELEIMSVKDDFRGIFHSKLVQIPSGNTCRKKQVY